MISEENYFEHQADRSFPDCTYLRHYICLEWNFVIGTRPHVGGEAATQIN